MIVIHQKVWMTKRTKSQKNILVVVVVVIVMAIIVTVIVTILLRNGDIGLVDLFETCY